MLPTSLVIAPAAPHAERVCPRLFTCRMTTAQQPAADVDHGVLPHLAAPPQERPRQSLTFPQLQGTPLPPSSAFAPQVPHSLRRPGLTSPLTTNSPPPRATPLPIAGFTTTSASARTRLRHGLTLVLTPLR